MFLRMLVQLHLEVLDHGNELLGCPEARLCHQGHLFEFDGLDIEQARPEGRQVRTLDLTY